MHDGPQHIAPGNDADQMVCFDDRQSPDAPFDEQSCDMPGIGIDTGCQHPVRHHGFNGLKLALPTGNTLRALALQKIAIGNDTDQPTPYANDRQVPEIVACEKLQRFPYRRFRGDTDNGRRHDLQGIEQWCGFPHSGIGFIVPLSSASTFMIL